MLRKCLVCFGSLWLLLSLEACATRNRKAIQRRGISSVVVPTAPTGGVGAAVVVAPAPAAPVAVPVSVVEPGDSNMKFDLVDIWKGRLDHGQWFLSFDVLCSSEMMDLRCGQISLSGVQYAVIPNRVGVVPSAKELEKVFLKPCKSKNIQGLMIGECGVASADEPIKGDEDKSKVFGFKTQAMSMGEIGSEELTLYFVLQTKGIDGKFSYEFFTFSANSQEEEAPKDEAPAVETPLVDEASPSPELDQPVPTTP